MYTAHSAVHGWVLICKVTFNCPRVIIMHWLVCSVISWPLPDVSRTPWLRPIMFTASSGNRKWFSRLLYEYIPRFTFATTTSVSYDEVAGITLIVPSHFLPTPIESFPFPMPAITIFRILESREMRTFRTKITKLIVAPAALSIVIFHHHFHSFVSNFLLYLPLPVALQKTGLVSHTYNMPFPFPCHNDIYSHSHGNPFPMHTCAPVFIWRWLIMNDSGSDGRCPYIGGFWCTQLTILLVHEAAECLDRSLRVDRTYYV